MTDRLSGGAPGAGGGAPSVFGTGLARAGPSGTVTTLVPPPGEPLISLGTMADPVVFAAGTWYSVATWFMEVSAAGMATYVNVYINGVLQADPEVETLGTSAGAASRSVILTLTFPTPTPIWFDLVCGKASGPAGTIAYSRAELIVYRIS